MNQFTYMKDREFSKGRKYIGASDMPTLTKINPYETPMELWEKLTGRAEQQPSSGYAYWGNMQEPIILGEYIRKITGDMKTRNDFITSRMWGETQFLDFHSWTEAKSPDGKYCAHADLLDMSGDIPIIIQAKNSGEFAAAQRKRDPNKGYDKEDMSSNGIPLSVFFQEQWEMYMYGIPKAWVVVLIGGNNWKLYGPIEYDKKTVEKLLALSERMMWHVAKDTAPTPETWGDVIKLYPNFKKNTKAVVSDDAEIECREMLEEHTKIGRKIKELEHRKDDIKNALGLYIGGNNYLETPDGYGLASASEISGRFSISVTALKKFPELFKQVEGNGLISLSDGYRQLYIKGTPAGNITTYTLLTTDDGEKWKKSRKKYTADEKKEAAALLKSLKISARWEKVINNNFKKPDPIYQDNIKTIFGHLPDNKIITLKPTKKGIEVIDIKSKEETND